jgi:initiation factor 1A
MPPNLKGGKGYRKGKHATADEAKMLDWDESQGQMLGRALRKLGDRRFRVFCNDSKERICKLAGGMRKSEWVDEGAIILIGIRQLTTATTVKGEEIGDILSVIDTRIYGKLKKQDGVNPLLFTHVEDEDAAAMKKKINALKSGEGVDDDVFEREGEESDDSKADEESEDENGVSSKDSIPLTEEQKAEKEREREAKRKLRDQELTAKRSNKRPTVDDDDFNIADI